MRRHSLSETQLAYLAGLIDGEGSLECQKYMQPRGRTHRYVIRLAFVMGTEEPLRTVAEWLGLGLRHYPAVDDIRQPRIRMDIPKGLLVPLLLDCLPFLILKRRQAELILQIESARAEGTPSWNGLGMPKATVDKMESLHLELRSMKSNKRPISCR